MFIHDAVLESLTCGDSQIPASGLSGAVKKLKEKDSESGRTGFETQFHVCTTTFFGCIIIQSWLHLTDKCLGLDVQCHLSFS